MNHSPRPDHEILEALHRIGLMADDVRFEALAGGVSSDIWKVEIGDRVFCVKRALPKLKVAADWVAPVERNRFEAAWYEIANQIIPGVAPRVLAYDEDAILFAMDYLDPATHNLWKSELRDGRADPSQAEQVGRRLVRVHAATADDEAVRERFPRTDIFQAIRLEPYLEATAACHPDLRNSLFALSRRTAATRLTMIHGDVSPKNILIGPAGPVFIDAECACMGDPVFDLAFCLNHLLLKCLWKPNAREGYFDGFAQLVTGYMEGVTWEERTETEARAASLLPGLFLARVDGKSPVEYLNDQADKNRVRRCARRLLRTPPRRLIEVLDAWKRELNS
ncbi:MAG: aminoglycoside phosphotransferase family protein [Gammaproteobacteria bacterium]|nr:aminoglycoside phosphotransferase family protein [Gammaproteobacteria bacterium]